MKNLFPAVLMLLSTCVFADEMQFITVLSTPVGSFNRLEAVDPSAPAQGATVNFCTKIGTEGRVQLKGNNNVGIENTNLSMDTTLGRSTAGDYVLQKITLNSAGELKGSRLLSNVVKVSGQGVGKSDNLYGDTLTVAGAKTKSLNVGNGKSVMAGTGSAATMVWSNEYQEDSACKEGSSYEKCKKQYLLKQFGGAVAEETGKCYDKYKANTIESYCAQFGLWPKNYGPITSEGSFNSGTKSSPSNCCRTCGSMGGVVNENGQCVWGEGQTGDSKPVWAVYIEGNGVVVRETSPMGSSGSQMQCGATAGGGGKCDVSGKAVNLSDFRANFTQAQWKEACAQNCRQEIYGVENNNYLSNWKIWPDLLYIHGGNRGQFCLLGSGSSPRTVQSVTEAADNNPAFKGTITASPPFDSWKASELYVDVTFQSGDVDSLCKSKINESPLCSGVNVGFAGEPDLVKEYGTYYLTPQNPQPTIVQIRIPKRYDVRAVKATAYTCVCDDSEDIGMPINWRNFN